MKPNPKQFIWLLLILLASAIVFGSLLHAPSLHWDDDANIFANPFFASGTWTEFWNAPYYGLYVPVTYNVWGLVYWLGGGEAWPFRVLNLLLHACNITLLWILLRALGRRWNFSFGAIVFGTLVFALHPMQVHAVAWLSGGRDLLATFFALATVAVYFRRQDSSMAGLATLLFIFATLSKPIAVVLPAVLMGLDILLNGRVVLRSRIMLILWTFLAAGVVLLTRQAQVDFLEQNFDFWARGMVVLDTYCFYLLKFIYPLDLAVNYARTPSVALADSDLWWYAALSAGVFGGFLFLAARVDRRYGLIFIWALALLPVSGVVPFGFQLISTVSDHYHYLPMAGMSALGAFVISRIDGLRTRSSAFNCAMAILLAVLTALSWRQTRTWTSDAAFFSQMAISAPDSYSTAIGMSLVQCAQLADYERGANWTEKALAAKPNDIHALANRAYCFLHAKDYFRVVELETYLNELDLDELEAKHPTAYASFLASIAAAYMEQKYYGEAMEFLCEARRVQPMEPSYARDLVLATRILKENGLNSECESP